MIYELWDFEAATIIYTYPSEAAALAMVAGQVAAFGQEGAATWMLLANDGAETDAGLWEIAHGEALVALAERRHTPAAD